MTKILTLGLLFSMTAFGSFVNPPYPTAKGGTGTASQTNNRAVTTDASSHLVSTSSTTDTEIGFVHGLTSSVQTQINGLATVSLNNLSGVAFDSDLIPDATQTRNVGSSVKALNSVFTVGAMLESSSTGFYTEIAAAANGTGYRVVMPPAQGFPGQYPQNDGSGNLSWVSPSVPSASVTDGGNAAYSIPSTNNIHVRTSTTLTAQRTYTLPVCNTAAIGTRVDVKNTPSQTFNIVVAANGSDNIDGNANYTLAPGDNLKVVCAAFSANGTWDIE